MLIKYLKRLKKEMSKDDFKFMLIDVENDIRVNRVAYGKRTGPKDFINICESLRRAMAK
ncbi:hypothetical protein [Clostridium sp.]|uniref:hypothetical protein n=1 Tax=Clostridium sp. TaxID=1506 RepID=UPI0025B8C3FE|nr:hypothetical protein [Clostridium sp.]